MYATIAETNLQNGCGKCPACNSWNSFYEEKIQKDTKAGTTKRISDADVVKLNTVEAKTYDRTKTGIQELDRVLGGGLVQGSLILLGGEPGIRKINTNTSDM